MLQDRAIAKARTKSKVLHAVLFAPKPRPPPKGRQNPHAFLDEPASSVSWPLRLPLHPTSSPQLGCFGWISFGVCGGTGVATLVAT